MYCWVWPTNSLCFLLFLACCWEAGLFLLCSTQSGGMNSTGLLQAVLSPRQGTHINQMPHKFIIFLKEPEEMCCTRPGQGSQQPARKIVYFFLNFPLAATCYFLSSNMSFWEKIASILSLQALALWDLLTGTLRHSSNRSNTLH